MAVQQYTLEEVREITNDFRTEIGEGGFSKIYKGIIHRGTRREEVVAVKSYQVSATTMEQFNAEKDSLSELRHENVIKLKGYVENKNFLILVLEYVSTSLDAVIEDLDWQDTLRILKQTASALEYIHKYGDRSYVFVDFKPDNIMIDEANTAKLIDFGSIVRRGRSYTRSYSKGYAAPEVQKGANAPTQKADVYSFGVVMLQLMKKLHQVEPDKNQAGRRGRRGELKKYIVLAADEEFKLGGHYVHKTLLGTRNNCSKETAIQITTLALHCTEKGANSRPTMEEVIRRLDQF